MRPWVSGDTVLPGLGCEAPYAHLFRPRMIMLFSGKEESLAVHGVCPFTVIAESHS